MRLVLVSGDAGFIGSVVVRYRAGELGIKMPNVDKFTSAGNLDSLGLVLSLSNSRFACGDTIDCAGLSAPLAELRPIGIIHLAARNLVDRSITGAGDLVRTNTVGTWRCCRPRGLTGLAFTSKPGQPYTSYKCRSMRYVRHTLGTSFPMLLFSKPAQLVRQQGLYVLQPPCDRGFQYDKETYNQPSWGLFMSGNLAPIADKYLETLVA